MKPLLCILLLLQLSWPSANAQSNLMYNQKIVVEPGSQEEVLLIAEELKYWLELGTEKTFSISQNFSHPSIVLTLKMPNIRNSEIDKLQNGSALGFYLAADNQQVMILAKSEKGLLNGVYYYLDLLGYRWFAPGEKWTHIPILETLQMNFERAVFPSLGSSKFFGTGGFDRFTKFDPELKVQAQWKIWQERNMWSEEFRFPGHYGEGFNKRNRETFEKNPQWMAQVDGKREWWKGLKYCYSNAALRKFIIDDALDRARQNEEFPSVLALDPADGSKHCTCKACQAMGSVSNRVFGMANDVAKALQSKHPSTGVALYAYNKHADVPDFILEPNVHISLAPYKFQSFKSPEELLKQWSEKTNNLFLRDYWGLPDWSKDLPTTNFEKSILPKLKFWRELNIKGYIIETSYASGPMSLPLYLANQYNWFPEKSLDYLLKEYYELMFENAGSDIKQLHERWWKQYLGKSEVAITTSNLKQAGRQTESKLVHERLTDLKAYALYLHAYHQFLDTEEGSQEQFQKAEDLLYTIWGIQPRAVIHSYYIHRLLTFKWTKKNPSFLKKWNIRKKNFGNGDWNSLEAWTDSEIEKRFKALPESQFVGLYQGISDPISTTKSMRLNGASKGQGSNRFITQSDHRFELGLIGSKKLQIDLKIEKRAGAKKDPLVVLSLLDMDGKELHSQNFTQLGAFSFIRELQTNIPYQIKLELKAARCDIQFPSNAMVGVVGKVNNAEKGRLYFIAPQGKEEILVELGSSVGLELVGSQGKKIALRLAEGNIYRATIPAEDRNQLIGIRFKKPGFKLVNVKQLLLLTDTYLPH